MKRIGWILATGFAALMAGASILFRPAPKSQGSDHRVWDRWM